MRIAEETVFLEEKIRMAAQNFSTTDFTCVASLAATTSTSLCAPPASILIEGFLSTFWYHWVSEPFTSKRSTFHHPTQTRWVPQKRISICTSRAVGSRRGIVVEARGEVELAAA